VTELERALLDLAAHVEFPPAPALRVPAAPPARRWPVRRFVLALALLAAAAAAVFALSPGARGAILDWLGIEGVRIERVPELPDLPLRTDRPFGRPASLAEARRTVSYDVRVPRLRGLDAPQVFVDDFVPGGLVTLVYGDRRHPRLLLSQWPGTTVPYFSKLISYSVRARRVGVDGGRGLWLTGPPHLVAYRTRDGSLGTTEVYLAGDVLLWSRAGMSYRLELDAGLEAALRVAGALE
jgi:hypothetical protein